MMVRCLTIPTQKAWIVCVAVLLALAAKPARAQLPATQLFAVSPPGGRQGTVVDLVIAAGADLDGVGQLHFSHPGITASQKLAEPKPFQTTPDPIIGQFTVTMAPDVPPGVYDVRAAGTFGISNPRAFVVSDLPELKEPGGNNTRQTAVAVELGSVVNGTSDGAAADWFKFSALAGQRVVMDCWAQRIDSRMDGTLVVYDAAGRELARSRDSNRRDPLVDLAVPADGEYLVKLYDFIYGGGAEYFYRLTIGTGPYIDFIVPPAGAPGTKGQYTIYGRNLPGGSPAEGIAVDGRPLEQLAVEIEIPGDRITDRMATGTMIEPEDSSLDGMDYRLQTPQGTSNSVFLGFATAPVAVEQEPNDEPSQAQAVRLPCEYAGRFDRAGDLDWLTFEAKKGEVYWAEIISERLGVATDPYLLIQRVTRSDQGQEQLADIQELDDDGKNIGGLAYNTATDDANFRFLVPEDGTYRVLVRDLCYTPRGDPRRLYRLSLRPEQPDFRLVAVPPYPAANQTEARPWNPLLRRGGTETIAVLAFRRDGFAGEIVVSAEGLPEGVACPAATIGPGMDATSLVLTASEQAPAWAGTIRIVGRAKIGADEVAREARAGSVLFAAPQNTSAEARMARGLALAVSGSEAAPFLVDLGESKTWDMSRAGKLLIPVKVTRRGEIKANLTLAPLGLPPNVQPQALALDGNTNEGNFELQINPNAPLGSFTIYLQVQTTVAYRRDVAAAEAAAAAKADLEKVAAELAAPAQVADEARQAADKAAADADAAAKAAAVAKEAADLAAKQAADEAKVAADKAAEAKAAADSDPNNQDLAAALEVATKAAADADAKAKTAAEAQVVAEKAATDEAARAEAAIEAKAQADAAAAEAAARAKAAADASAAATQRATDTANAATPKDVAVFLPSTTATLKITPAPVTLSVNAPAGALKQAAQLEVPFTLTRLYSYAESVQVEVVLPSGASGLKVAPVTVAAGQTEGKLTVEAAADASPGNHALVLRATAAFNGQNLQVDETLPLVVEKADGAN